MPSLEEIGLMAQERKISKIACVISLSLLSLLGKECGPSFEKFEFTSPKDHVPVFCRKFVNVYKLFSLFNFPQCNAAK